MIYKYSLLAVMLLQTYSVVSQTTHWVSNRNDGVEVDFTSLQAAVDAASPGDTIIVYPSSIGYGNLNVVKEIHIKGMGYKFDTYSQPSLEITTFQQPVYITNLGINVPGDGSTFESIAIANMLVLDADSVSLIRSEIQNDLLFNNSSYNKVQSCHIYSNQVGNVIELINSSFNLIENCCSNSVSYVSLNSDVNSANNIISQNVFTTVTAYSSLIYNNIFLSNTIFGNTNELLNNVFLGGPPSQDDDNNIYGATNVFVGYPTQGSYSFDTRWHLTPTSPAAGAGLNGEDCGIFGGPNPYKLSGIHNRPLIYELSVPQHVPNGSDLNITVKVRAEN